MKAQYKIVCFDIDKPLVPSNALFKIIPQADFKLLQDDYITGIELNDIKYEITQRRWFIHTQFEGNVIIMILDIKRKTA